MEENLESINKTSYMGNWFLIRVPRQFSAKIIAFSINMLEQVNTHMQDKVEPLPTSRDIKKLTQNEF